MFATGLCLAIFASLMESILGYESGPWQKRDWFIVLPGLTGFGLMFYSILTLLWKYLP